MILNVNSEQHEVDVPDDVPLLWVLREELGLTGPKFGCGKALCGACTVHVGGEPRRACSFPVGDVGDREVTTIEGLSDGAALHPVQQVWHDEGVAQCGFCQPGQIMQAVALLRNKPNPTDDDIDAAMSASLCRCGTYPRIRRAIKIAAEHFDEPSTEGDDHAHEPA